MNTTEMVTRACIAGALTDEEGDALLDAAIRTESAITCPFTGVVIDTSTSLMLEVRDGSRWIRPTRLIDGVLNIASADARGVMEGIVDNDENFRIFDAAESWGKVKVHA